MGVSPLPPLPACTLTVTQSVHGSPITSSALVFCFILAKGNPLRVSDHRGVNTWMGKAAFVSSTVLSYSVLATHLNVHCENMKWMGKFLDNFFYWQLFVALNCRALSAKPLPLLNLPVNYSSSHALTQIALPPFFFTVLFQVASVRHEQETRRQADVIVLTAAVKGGSLLGAEPTSIHPASINLH